MPAAEVGMDATGTAARTIGVHGRGWISGLWQPPMAGCWDQWIASSELVPVCLPGMPQQREGVTSVSMPCLPWIAWGWARRRGSGADSTLTVHQSTPSPSAWPCTVLFCYSPYAQQKRQQPQEREKGRRVLKSSHPPCCSWTE